MQSQGSALYFAVLNNQMDVIQLLIDRSADINLPNKTGQTPLHVAQSPEVAQVLMDAHCHVDGQNTVRESLSHCCLWYTLTAVGVSSSGKLRRTTTLCWVQRRWKSSPAAQPWQTR